MRWVWRLPRRDRVLNAFRHHRGGHQSLVDKVRKPLECSTPFGITEGGIPAPWFNGSSLVACSTPFGITEGGIRRGRDDRVHHVECSTPFGITEGGIPILEEGWQPGGQVLNAFRHHRGGHLPVLPVSPAKPVCSTPFGITEEGIC